MSRKIPDWFLKPIQAYDRALSIRWAPKANHYALERDMHESSSETINQLKAVLWRFSNRKIRLGLSVQKHREVEQRRREVAERLQSLHNRKRIIFFIEELNQATLDATLRTLRESDLWNKEGVPDYDKDHRSDHAKKVSDKMEDDELDAEERQRRQFRRDVRYTAWDCWRDVQRRGGERFNNPGLPGKSRVIPVQRPPLIVPGR